MLLTVKMEQAAGQVAVMICSCWPLEIADRPQRRQRGQLKMTNGSRLSRRAMDKNVRPPVRKISGSLSGKAKKACAMKTEYKPVCPLCVEKQTDMSILISVRSGGIVTSNSPISTTHVSPSYTVVRQISTKLFICSHILY